MFACGSLSRIYIGIWRLYMLILYIILCNIYTIISIDGMCMCGVCGVEVCGVCSFSDEYL